MFEEIAVWVRANSNVAVRYVGFRDLETERVWIAFGNYVGGDEDDGEVSSDQMIAPQATLEGFLQQLPPHAEAWKATISEAVAYFVETNPSRVEP